MTRASRATLTLRIPAVGSSSHQALIGRYLRMVPVPAEKVKEVELRRTALREVNGDVTMSVTLASKLDSPLALFVEGPDAYHFDTPRQVHGSDPHVVEFDIRVDGADSADSLRGQMVKFTIVQGGLRLEQTSRLN